MKNKWMSHTLLLAALYNIIWGAYVIIFPNHFFSIIDLPLPTYPQIWQCVGMIVGVYGLGYLFAAADPQKHWPIVVVGFLGKIFGPIGFLQAILMDTLPIEFGYTIITNDLIWWVPFFLIIKSSKHQIKDDLIRLKNIFK